MVKTFKNCCASKTCQLGYALLRKQSQQNATETLENNIPKLLRKYSQRSKIADVLKQTPKMFKTGNFKS